MATADSARPLTADLDAATAAARNCIFEADALRKAILATPERLDAGAHSAEAIERRPPVGASAVDLARRVRRAVESYYASPAAALEMIDLANVDFGRGWTVGGADCSTAHAAAARAADEVWHDFIETVEWDSTAAKGGEPVPERQRAVDLRRLAFRTGRDLPAELTREILDALERENARAKRWAVEASRPAESPQAAEPERETISADEAEAVARRLDKKDIAFRHGSAEQWAARIEAETGKCCSAALVKRKLRFWGEVMAETGRSRRRRGASGAKPKTVRFSEAVAATVGRGDALEDLASQREAGEVTQAVARVGRSRLSDEAKAATVEKLRSGRMTPRAAVEMVEILERRS